MDQASVHEMMDVSATSTITIFEQGQTYVFEYYPLQTAQSKSTNTTNNNGAFGQIPSKVTTTTITDHTHALIVLYKERRLRSWGVMGDFS